ncbi:hypothetical protein PCHDK_000512700, partial [Plasmodium chabaudi adami]
MHLSCYGHDHTPVVKLMREVVKHLEYHATSKDGYKAYPLNHGDATSYYKKRHNGQTDILKINLNTYPSSQYDEIINKSWDPDTPNTFNTGIAKTYPLNHGDATSYYKKRHNGQTDILKINLNTYPSSQYDEIINKSWDPDTPNTFNTGIAK